MPDTYEVTIAVPPVTTTLDLSALMNESYAGVRLIRISYVHERYVPKMSGPVLHFRMQDSNVVLAKPDTEGCRLAWQANDETAVVDEDTDDWMRTMWHELEDQFQGTLLPDFTAAAARAVSAALRL
ncbi:hypothetical protein [Amycolatopsis sp. WGS_07]|uniref:hypothetical protein n=1 Tax=Amycolatopsis sp. WGS_07 TaxID=3076764 RepID=UPI003873171A